MNYLFTMDRFMVLKVHSLYHISFVWLFLYNLNYINARRILKVTQSLDLLIQDKLLAMQCLKYNV